MGMVTRLDARSRLDHPWADHNETEEKAMKHCLGLALLATATLAGGPAHAAASTPVTVIMPAEIEKGADPARAIVAMKEIVSYVHK